jgi:hypothetical protein
LKAVRLISIVDFLAHFAFDMYDLEGNGLLDEEDLETMLFEIFGKSKKNQYVRQ